MKSSLVLLILVSVLALLGCNTTATSTPPTAEQRAAQVAKISAAVEGLSAAAAGLYSAKHPEAGPWFLAAATVIEASANSGVFQPAAVQTALAKALDAPDAAAAAGALSAAFGLYQAFYGANVDSALDTAPAYRAALLGLARGVRSGAAQVPATGPAGAAIRVPEDLILR